MALHLADRPVHPRAVALPARRLARPVPLEAGLPSGWGGPQVRWSCELPAAACRARAEPLPRCPEVTLAAGLGHRGRHHPPHRLRLDARCPERTLWTLRPGAAPDGRVAPGRLRVAARP